MKAAVYYENGDPSVLRYEELPDPSVHPKGVVIRVEAVSIEGGDTLNRWKGPLVTSPHAGREEMKVDVGGMMGGNRSLSGVFLGAEIGTDRVHDNIQRLIEQVARGELTVVIDRVFSLAQAADAHAYIESRQAVGRVLLRP